MLLYMTRGEGPGREIAFVLGQESYVKDWNQSGCWSAFEGGRKAGKLRADRGAVSGNRRCSAAVWDERPGSDRCAASAGSMRCASASAGLGTAQQRNHVMFLVRIPWGTPVVEMFASVYGRSTTCSSAR